VARANLAAVNGHTELTVAAPPAEGADHLLPRLIETLAAHRAVIQKIVPEETTLEDVFIARTGRTLADDTRVR
jgi:hypothetical protein